MKKHTQWWHWLLALSVFVLLCISLWRAQSTPRMPNVTAEVSKGSNADAAMLLNTTGGD